MNDNERKKFMKDIRMVENPEYNDNKELKKYQKFVNSSAFEDFRKIEVSQYCGDTER